MSELAPLTQFVEQMVKEETLRAFQAEPRHKFSEFFVDPSSGEFSMSRFGMGALVLGMLALDLVGASLLLAGKLTAAHFESLADMNKVALGSLATVYTLNSAAGALGAGGIKGTVRAVIKKVLSPREKIQEPPPGT